MRTTERVTYRHHKCNCGCQGSDPWHKQSYRRAVRDIREEQGIGATRDIGDKQYKRVGFVRLPMSTRPVRVIDINMYTDSPYWVVDYDSVIFDK